MAPNMVNLETSPSLRGDLGSVTNMPGSPVPIPPYEASAPGCLQVERKRGVWNRVDVPHASNQHLRAPEPVLRISSENEELARSESRLLS